MHFGDPDFVLEGDPNPAKENILFFKADKKYVYVLRRKTSGFSRGI